MTSSVRRGQLVSSALFSLAHGGNDAQKVMGVIMAALIVWTYPRFGAGSLRMWRALGNFSGSSMYDVSPPWPLTISLSFASAEPSSR